MSRVTSVEASGCRQMAHPPRTRAASEAPAASSCATRRSGSRETAYTMDVRGRKRFVANAADQRKNQSDRY